ncbi:hypothetical protein [Costertonia aggregata]|uniref:Uncharacterized protein n=1 Tax=Costertonia aggregata TaxID=343403 RepID=A0A7H9AU82_9FLAO|nr:hypothetical protein [Costertonia aggregata]QLG47038.1 hypothetical protein HYG79_17310 [Costertonia aggregata]
MKLMLRIFSWKVTLLISVITLISLCILGFYGIYTDKFYFFKLDNYIFPILTIVHFIYLYAVWFKITENEYPDVPMRNLEYSLYLIFLVYLYKTVDSVLVVTSYHDFENFVLPSTFVPLGNTTVGLYVVLLFVTLLTFGHRRKSVGPYDFSSFNENMDSWQ